MVPAQEKTAEVEPSANAQDEPEVSYTANKFIQNKKSVEAVGGEQIALTLGFQNIGKETWKSYSVVSNQPTKSPCL